MCKRHHHQRFMLWLLCILRLTLVWGSLFQLRALSLNTRHLRSEYVSQVSLSSNSQPWLHVRIDYPWSWPTVLAVPRTIKFASLTRCIWGKIQVLLLSSKVPKWLPCRAQIKVFWVEFCERSKHALRALKKLKMIVMPRNYRTCTVCCEQLPIVGPMSILTKFLKLFAAVDTRGEALCHGKLVWSGHLSLAKMFCLTFVLDVCHGPPDLPGYVLILLTSLSPTAQAPGILAWTLVDLGWGICCASPAILIHRNQQLSTENTCVFVQSSWRQLFSSRLGEHFLGLGPFYPLH